uniref:Reprolysin n=1 Tax=Rhipicephalus appendiculatus TaxID=34631 RepID=A0A131Z2T6_RHIAP
MPRFALTYLLRFAIVVYSTESLDEPGILVYPLLLETRSGDGQKTVHLSDGNFVHLQRASVLHDTLTVYSYENKKRIVQTIDSKNIEENLFENKKTFASLLLEETEHGFIMEGLVNHTYRIEPSLEAQRSDSGQIAHTLYVVRPHEADFSESISALEPPPDQFKIEARADLPKVFRPDIFLISDYEHGRHFATLQKLVSYLVIFFNGWGQDSYEVMYGKDMIAENTLTNFQSYIEGRLSDFVGADAVMLVTGHSMVSVSTGRVRPGVAGLAMTGGMCTRRRVGQSLDVGRGYAGVVHLAHELAHIMGSSHDQAAPVANIPGNRGAYHCRWSDGYIMSYDSKDERQFAFSHCSQEQFVVFLMYVPQSCIDNTWKGKLPKRSKRFPGDTFTRNKFCRSSSGFANSKECTKRHGDDLCKITCCPGKDMYGRNVDKAEIWCLDGANCGKNKECYSGYCQNKRRE